MTKLDKNFHVNLQIQKLKMKSLLI